MKSSKLTISLILMIVTLFMHTLEAQYVSVEGVSIDSNIVNRTWPARWITATHGLYDMQGEGFFLFKKHFRLYEMPEEFIIHVSADNRYRLYVNGDHVGEGPAQGTVTNWQFDTYDISEYLRSGENIIGSEVWQWGKKRPWTQQTHRTAFILQGNRETESIVNTGDSWLVKKCNVVTFHTIPQSEFPFTTGVGPSENWELSKYPYGWNEGGASLEGFGIAAPLNHGHPAQTETSVPGYEWQLYPRRIPFMEKKETRYSDVIRITDGFNADFLKGEPVRIKPGQTIQLLIDQSHIINGYPVLNVSGGKGAQIRLTYAEALMDEQFRKFERNRIEGLGCRGLYDTFIPDGGRDRVIKPLWYRTFRFIQLDIQTANEPLLLNDFFFIFSAYPFELKSKFECSDVLLNEIFEAGWRTARMCAMETYMDCPYYERLQYFFDSALSAPVTAQLSGDPRLLRNAIIYGYDSIKGGDHITCAYPDQVTGRIIPFFSIAWIDMIHQYLMQTGNAAEVYKWKDGIIRIMDWYVARLNKKHLLGPMPFWNFVDCNREWLWNPDEASICEPTGTKTGNSALLSLQCVYGLKKAVSILGYLGNKEKDYEYEIQAETIMDAIRRFCYDNKRMCFAETPDKEVFSQHTNTLAALTGCVQGSEARNLLKRLINDTTLLQMSTQFQSFYHKALLEHGMQGEFIQHLDTWKKLIRLGFTTFPEYPELGTRSDCHMWNAHPAAGLIRIVCGIRPVEFGFREFIIQPALGDLEWVKGSLYHPAGNITIHVRNDEGKYSGTVFIPEGIKAELILKDRTIKLKSGDKYIF